MLPPQMVEILEARMNCRYSGLDAFLILIIFFQGCSQGCSIDDLQKQLKEVQNICEVRK